MFGGSCRCSPQSSIPNAPIFNPLVGRCCQTSAPDGQALELPKSNTKTGCLSHDNEGPRQRSLVDVAGPALLLYALDGVDREQYRAMFSCDDETIEAGDEDIMAS